MFWVLVDPHSWVIFRQWSRKNMNIWVVKFWLEVSKIYVEWTFIFLAPLSVHQLKSKALVWWRLCVAKFNNRAFGVCRALQSWESRPIVNHLWCCKDHNNAYFELAIKMNSKAHKVVTIFVPPEMVWMCTKWTYLNKDF